MILNKKEKLPMTKTWVSSSISMFVCRVDPAVRSCPALSRPQHGFLRCGNSGATHRMECQVGCERGYRLEGPARLVCQADSQWSGSQPRCVGKPHPKSLSPALCRNAWKRVACSSHEVFSIFLQLSYKI